jgi:4-carboxymuconolactone decarboxylase
MGYEVKRIKFLSRIAVLTSLGKSRILKRHIELAISEGVSIKDIEEVILQCYLFAGFPAAIEGLRVLRELTGPMIPLKKRKDSQKFLSIGIRTCRKVYGKSYDNFILNMLKLSPDITSWIISEGYGKVLSRKVLSLKERELLSVAVLTSLGWRRQLLSHIRGAINVGARKREVRDVIRYISDICGRRKTDMALSLLDSI